MIARDAEKTIRRYSAIHKIRLLYPSMMPERNEGGQSRRTIWLGEFDEADCLVAAFFHEVGHIIDCRKKSSRNHRITLFEHELRAWVFGSEEMHRFGIGTTAKMFEYMVNRINSYT